MNDDTPTRTWHAHQFIVHGQFLWIRMSTLSHDEPSNRTFEFSTWECKLSNIQIKNWYSKESWDPMLPRWDGRTHQTENRGDDRCWSQHSIAQWESECAYCISPFTNINNNYFSFLFTQFRALWRTWIGFRVHNFISYDCTLCSIRHPPTPPLDSIRCMNGNVSITWATTKKKKTVNRTVSLLALSGHTSSERNRNVSREDAEWVVLSTTETE